MYFSLHPATVGRKLPHEEFVRLAAAVGFPAADPDFTYADTHSLAAMQDLYGSLNLRFGGWGVPFNFRDPAGMDPEGIARLKRFAKYAAAVGIDNCGNHIMPCAELPFQENWDFLVSRIKPLAAILADHGLRFGLEPVAPHHQRVRFPHAFLFSPFQLLELADTIGPNVGLLVDSIHLYTAGEPMACLQSIPVNRIVHAHLNDAPGGPVHLVHDMQRLLPGQGAIDVPGYLAALKSIGYAGAVSLEVFSPVLDAMPPAESGRLAWQSVRGLGV